MLTLSEIARALNGRIVGSSVRAPSPGHSDADDGMSITISDGTPDGFIVHTFNGTDDLAAKDYVREKLGLPAFEPTMKTTKPASIIIATYDYTTADGVLLYQVVRYSPKAFKQRRPRAGRGWIPNRGNTPAVLYRLPELLQYPDATVFFTEGEADADRLAKLGLVSTTVSGDAADKWTPELAEPLRGRDVFVLQDNDAKGLVRATAAAQALHGVARSVRVVLLPGLKPRGDISDWLKAGHSRAELETICVAAPLWQPEAAAEEPATDHEPPASKLTYFDDCRAFVPRPSILKGLLVRGETSAWIGPPKSGKSAFVVDMAVFCANRREWQGHKAKETCGVLILALERADLCKRRLHAYAVRDDLKGLPIAVRSGVVDLMNPVCVDLIIQEVREAETHFGCPVGLIIIDTFNKSIAAGGGDEDKARDQNRVAVNLRRLHEQLSVHVALVGHTGKDETRGARGSNAHLGDVDVMVQISGDIIKQAQVTNANDQPERVLALFKLDPFDLGADEDGDPITVAIVSTEAIAAAAPKASEPKLTKNEKTMFGILHDAGRSGLSTEQWNNAGRAAGIGHGRRADLHDAQNGLKRKKLVREYQDRWHVNHRQDDVP
jgi:hypothetical protein